MPVYTNTIALIVGYDVRSSHDFDSEQEGKFSVTKVNANTVSIQKNTNITQCTTQTIYYPEQIQEIKWANDLLAGQQAIAVLSTASEALIQSITINYGDSFSQQRKLNIQGNSFSTFCISNHEIFCACILNTGKIKIARILPASPDQISSIEIPIDGYSPDHLDQAILIAPHRLGCIVAHKGMIYVLHFQEQGLVIHHTFNNMMSHFVGVCSVTLDSTSPLTQIRALTKSGELFVFNEALQRLSVINTKITNCIQMVSTPTLIGVLNPNQLRVLHVSTETQRMVSIGTINLNQTEGQYTALCIINSGFFLFDNHLKKWWVPLISDIKKEREAIAMLEPIQYTPNRSLVSQRDSTHLMSSIFLTSSEQDSISFCCLVNNSLVFSTYNTQTKAITTQGCQTINGITAICPYTIHNETRYLLAINNQVYNVNLKGYIDIREMTDVKDISRDLVLYLRDTHKIHNIIKLHQNNEPIVILLADQFLLTVKLGTSPQEFNIIGQPVELASDLIHPYVIVNNDNIYLINRNLINGRIQYQHYRLDKNLILINTNTIEFPQYDPRLESKSLNIIGSVSNVIFFSYKVENRFQLFSFNIRTQNIINQNHKLTNIHEVTCMIVKGERIGFAGKYYSNSNNPNQYVTNFTIAQLSNFEKILEGTFPQLQCNITAFNFNFDLQNIREVFAIDESGNFCIYNHHHLMRNSAYTHAHAHDSDDGGDDDKNTKDPNAHSAIFSDSCERLETFLTTNPRLTGAQRIQLSNLRQAINSALSTPPANTMGNRLFDDASKKATAAVAAVVATTNSH